MNLQNQMQLPAALEALHELRGDAVVVTTMGAAREWVKLTPCDLDWVYVPSSMGQAPSLGLGIALAQPDRSVVVCNGDGCMLMNLGSLVTISAVAPEKFILVIIDNGVYEVTGGQDTVGSGARRADGRAVRLADVARACGFTSVHEFDLLEDWQNQLPGILESKGPTFVVLQVEPMQGDVTPRSPGPAAERVVRFMAAIQGDPGA